MSKYQVGDVFRIVQADGRFPKRSLGTTITLVAPLTATVWAAHFNDIHYGHDCFRGDLFPDGCGWQTVEKWLDELCVPVSAGDDKIDILPPDIDEVL